MTAPKAATARKRRPSFSLSLQAIQRLAVLTADTAARRGTKANASALLEELIQDEMRRRHLDGGGPGVASTARKGKAV